IFGEEQEIFNKNYSIEDIFIVDLDNDDDNDVVLGNSEAGSVLSFINLDGNGNFSDGYTILNSFDGAYALGMADIDSNDTLDLCVASTYLNKIAWLPGKDGQSFYSPILINESQLQDPKYIVTGDFAGDKQSDIIVSNYRDNSLKMFKNKNFGQSYVFNVINEEGGKKERLIASSDLDNDGRIDLIEAQRNYAYSTLNWYKNLNEIGDFSVHGILVNNLPPLTYLTTADLDGDNDPDIIVVSETGNNVSYIKNKGQGKFEKDLNLITDQLQNPSMVNIADFNGDGLLDLIVSSFSNNYIYLFINNNGSFSLQQANIPNPVNTPKFIASGDLDKDGYNDIIFSSFGNYGLYWMKNVNGSFNTPKKVYPSYYSSPDKIIIKDLDSDNDPDIIIMDKTYNTVSWFENISKDGYFSKPLDIINGINGVSDIGYGFINNDSFPDILTLSENENNLYVNIAEIGPQIIKQPQDTAVCDTQDIVLTIEFDKADSLSWQVMKKNPSYFEGVSNDSIYQGVKTQNLHIKANPDLDRYKYRCMLFYNNRVFFSDTATLQVFDKIEANAGKDDTTCLSYYFLNSNLAGNGIGVWAVLNGNGEIEEPAKNFTKVNNLSTGNNTFKWTISNGLCQDYDEVVIYKFDSIQIVQQPESLSLSKGSTAQLKLTTNTDGDFQWYFNGYELTDNDRIQGSKTSSLTITDIDSTDIGNYRCFVEGYCNQIYSDLVTLDITTSTGDLEFNTVSIYPNPVKTTLNVNCYQEITFLKLLDINGKIIINLKNPKNTIDISNLDTGIYFVKIITANNIFFTKIVKM
ncbi:MAG TPA: T9SS type A sorting domain-containing protein, partial [Bacteroidetes bacterium]|nr:T9SS type A sorting domain-containing protein [Bacteroidota bacterium]